MIPRAKTDTDQEQRTHHVVLPPYSVILHNDDVHDMDYVVQALQKRPSLLKTPTPQSPAL